MPAVVFARQTANGPQFAEHSGERLVNMFAEPNPDGGIGPLILAPAPGLTPLVTLSLGNPVRALYSEQGVVYAACNGRLWSVTSAGVATDLGSIGGDDESASIAGNGFDIAVASNGIYTVHNKETRATTIVSPGVFAETGSVTKLDNYIILSQLNGQAFAITALANASSINALDFASAESAPDDVVKVIADHSELWFFGTRSVEIWGNTGNADFPFQRLSGGIIERGCAFAASVTKDDNSVFWVGDDRLAYRANGQTPQIISPPWVSEILATATDARGFTFTYRGHKCYGLRILGRTTLVFDMATGLWHERSTGLDDGPWRATCVDRLAEWQFVGGDNGVIYTLGGLMDGTTPILREGVSIPLTGPRFDHFSLSRLRLLFKTGATDIGREARVALQISREGRTWTPEKWAPLGNLGEYLRPVKWSALGSGRSFRARFRITDPIDVALYGATFEAA